MFRPLSTRSPHSGPPPTPLLVGLRPLRRAQCQPWTHAGLRRTVLRAPAENVMGRRWGTQAPGCRVPVPPGCPPREGATLAVPLAVPLAEMRVYWPLTKGGQLKSQWRVSGRCGGWEGRQCREPGICPPPPEQPGVLPGWGALGSARLSVSVCILVCDPIPHAQRQRT